MNDTSTVTPGNFTVAKSMSERVSIGREAAIALAESGWWNGKTPREIAGFCLTVEELSCPFTVLHEAVEKALGRPVFPHEFGMNFQGILNEFNSTETASTMEQILDLIPEEKRIVIQPA